MGWRIGEDLTRNIISGQGVFYGGRFRINILEGVEKKVTS